MRVTPIQAIIGSALIALAVTALVYFNSVSLVQGSAPSGLPATVASSSVLAVSSTQGIVAATSSCSARIITTHAQAVMLTFSDKDGDVPSGAYGHWQGASTTVAYDSGLYGCGSIRAFSSANGSLSVTEVQ